MSSAIFHEQHPCTSAGAAQAPQLVLLHGWGLNSGVWKDFLPRLTKYFRVTCIDVPGFGKSTGEVSCATFSKAMLALVPEPAVWMGWSLGGLLALDMAARYPQRVLALSLLATSPRFLQGPDWLAAMPKDVFADFADAVHENPLITLEGFLALQCKGSVSMKADLRFLQKVLKAGNTPPLPALLAGLHCLVESDLREDLHALNVPVQFLLGEKDVLIPAALEPKLRLLNPEVQVSVITGAAHAPFISHPVICADVLRQFWRQVGVVA